MGPPLLSYRRAGVCWRRFVLFFALHTIERCPDPLRAAFAGQNPRPILPGWIVPDVPRVPTVEIGHPVVFFIPMEAGNFAIHLSCLAHHWRAWCQFLDPSQHAGVVRAFPIHTATVAAALKFVVELRRARRKQVQYFILRR